MTGDLGDFIKEKGLERTRIEELKKKMLNALKFPPEAQLSFALESSVGREYGVDYWTAAFGELLEEKLVGEKDGWLFKVRPKIIASSAL